MAKIPPESFKFAEALNTAMPDRKAEARVLQAQGFTSQQLGVVVGPPEGPPRYLVQRGTMVITVVDCIEGQPNRIVSNWYGPRNQGWYAKAAVQVRDIITKWEKTP